MRGFIVFLKLRKLNIMHTPDNVWYPSADDVLLKLNRMVPAIFPNYAGEAPDFQFLGNGRGLLESALARPLPLFGVEKYESIEEKAAALIWAITMNHPFTDGNKRSALTTGTFFLFVNGHSLLATNQEAVEMCLAVADGTRDFGEKDVVTWISDRAISIPEMASGEWKNRLDDFVSSAPPDQLRLLTLPFSIFHRAMLAADNRD